MSTCTFWIGYCHDCYFSTLNLGSDLFTRLPVICRLQYREDFLVSQCLLTSAAPQRENRKKRPVTEEPAVKAQISAAMPTAPGCEYCISRSLHEGAVFPRMGLHNILSQGIRRVDLWARVGYWIISVCYRHVEALESRVEELERS